MLTENVFIVAEEFSREQVHLIICHKKLKYLANLEKREGLRDLILRFLIIILLLWIYYNITNNKCKYKYFSNNIQNVMKNYIYFIKLVNWYPSTCREKHFLKYILSSYLEIHLQLFQVSIRIRIIIIDFVVTFFTGFSVVQRNFMTIVTRIFLNVLNFIAIALLKWDCVNLAIGFT